MTKVCSRALPMQCRSNMFSDPLSVPIYFHATPPGTSNGFSLNLLLRTLLKFVGTHQSSLKSGSSKRTHLLRHTHLCALISGSAARFNIQQFYVLPTQFIYVFCMNLRRNSDYFPIQH